MKKTLDMARSYKQILEVYLLGLDNIFHLICSSQVALPKAEADTVDMMEEEFHRYVLQEFRY